MPFIILFWVPNGLKKQVQVKQPNRLVIEQVLDLSGLDLRHHIVGAFQAMPQPKMMAYLVIYRKKAFVIICDIRVDCDGTNSPLVPMFVFCPWQEKDFVDPG